MQPTRAQYFRRRLVSYAIDAAQCRRALRHAASADFQWRTERRALHAEQCAALALCELGGLAGAW